MPIYGNNAAKLTKILATIFYTIDEYHPDILLYEDKNPNTIQTFSDVYRIDKSRFYGLDDNMIIKTLLLHIVEIYDIIKTDKKD